MKKVYLQPSMLFHGTCPDTMICAGSPNRENPTQGLDDDITPSGDNPGNFSRRKVWEEEEEEEW